MTQPFLSIQGIEKKYGPVTAVADVSLDIAEGEFVTFLGPSGSGKSTTLYAIAGFLEPTRGDVLLNGRTLLDVPSKKRNIGMVFQRYTLFPHLNVADNVAFPLKVRRVLPRRAAEEARRGCHRNAGGDSAAVQSHRDGAGEVQLPRLRGDHPAAGAVPRHAARLYRAAIAGHDHVRQVWNARAAEPAEPALQMRRH